MRLDVRCPKCGAITFAVSVKDDPNAYIVMEHIAPNGEWCAMDEINGKDALDVIVQLDSEQRANLLTPEPWIEALGPFDLDPCAAPAPRPWPTAGEHWDEQGLERDWHGFVWVNAIGLDVEAWIKRLSEHGNGIGLVPTRYIETRWFDRYIWAVADVVLITLGRPYFSTLSGHRAKRDFGGGMALVGYGPLAVKRLSSAPIDGNCLTEWVKTREPKDS